jgi:nitroimidazol reductase NimA-like FMN-containing flavoprotein (pyridoxamine 5'-phosphate oxidase superfamily)
MSGDERERAAWKVGPRQAVQLIPAECWQLLRGASVGRVVFTMNALPAIRPVNHLVDGRAIIIRSHLGSAIAGHASRDGAVVCYQADEIDPDRHTGWSVVATGLARLVREPGSGDSYREALEPWVADAMDQVIAITPQTIIGIRLVGWCG